MGDGDEPPKQQGGAIQPGPLALRSMVPSGVAVAAISGYLFMLTLAYESGFVGYFHVPIRLISVTWSDVLVAGAIFAFVLGLTVGLSDMLASLLFSPGPRTEAVRDRLRRTTALLILYIALTVANNFQSAGKNALLALGVVVLDWGTLVIRAPRRGEGFAKKVERAEASRGGWGGSLTFHALGERLGPVGALLVLSLLLLLALSHAKGAADARDETEFLVVQGEPLVVVRIYGDKLIAAPLDRNRKRVSRHIVVMRFQEDADFRLRLEPAGPLKPLGRREPGGR